MINPKLQETHHFILVTESKSVNRASRPKCCRGGGNLAIWLRTSCSRASREAEQIPPILGGCLACAEIGSWSLTWIFCVCLSHTDTHTQIRTHFYLAVPTTPMWRKTIATATDLSFQAITKEGPPSVPGLYMLLMVQQKYHLFSPSKDNTRRPHTKSVKLRDFYPFSIWLKRVLCPCAFRCDHECSVVSQRHTVGRCQVSWHTIS